MQNTLTHDLIFSRNSSTSVYEFQNIAELDRCKCIVKSHGKSSENATIYGPTQNRSTLWGTSCFILYLLYTFFFETLNITDLYERVLLGLARISSKNWISFLYIFFKRMGFFTSKIFITEEAKN